VTYPTPRTGRTFTRSLLGYAKAEVDAFVGETVAAADALRAQLGEAAANDPMARVGAEIASLLRSLAESVAAMHDDAERRAAELVGQAEETADKIRSDAEQEARRLTDKAESLHAIAAAKREQADQEAAATLHDMERRVGQFVQDQLSDARQKLEFIDRQAGVTEEQAGRAAEQLAAVLAELRAARETLHELAEGTDFGSDGTEPGKTPPPIADLTDGAGMSDPSELAGDGVPASVPTAGKAVSFASALGREI
jgi:hypothetical protein